MKAIAGWLAVWMLVSAGALAHADDETEAPGTVIYRSVDEHGNATFTDSPPEGRDAKAVRLGPTNTVPGQGRSRPAEAEVSPEPEFEGYQAIAIVAPVSQATLRDPQEAIAVTVALEPSLQQGHHLEILDNGQPLSGQALQNPERGSHVLIARVVDDQGRELIRSASVTVHVHRTSRLQGSRAPAPTGRAGIAQAAQRGGAAVVGSGSVRGEAAKAGSAASVGRPASRAKAIKSDS